MNFMSEHRVLGFTPHILGAGGSSRLTRRFVRRYCKVVGKFPGFVEDMEISSRITEYLNRGQLI